RARPSGRAAGPNSGAQPARGRAAAGGYRAVLADPGNVWLAVLNVASTLMCTAPIMAMPIYVLDHLHRPAWVPGLLAAISAAALAGAVLISHRFTGGHGRLAVLAVANVLWAGACLTFAVAGGVPASALGLLVAGVLLLGVAEAAYAPTADTLPLAIAPPALTGRYSALHQLSWGVSSIIAPIFTATLLAAGAAAVWLALAAVSALAAVAYAAAPRVLRNRAGRAGAATA
ncbi:MAG TPA: MFS transporter, partial [Pilimelia sp.]|nr:MFS transporter [Pilimelia sp.]